MKVLVVEKNIYNDNEQVHGVNIEHITNTYRQRILKVLPINYKFLDKDKTPHTFFSWFIVKLFPYNEGLRLHTPFYDSVTFRTVKWRCSLIIE